MEKTFQSKNLYTTIEDGEWNIDYTRNYKAVVNSPLSLMFGQLFLPRTIEEQIEFDEFGWSKKQMIAIKKQFNNLKAKDLFVAKVLQSNGKKQQYVPMLFKVCKTQGKDELKIPYFEDFKTAPYVFECGKTIPATKIFDFDDDEQITPILFYTALKALSTKQIGEKLDTETGRQKKAVPYEPEF